MSAANRRRWLFVASSAVLVLSVAPAMANGDFELARELESLTVGGKLDARDFAEIRNLVTKYCRTRHIRLIKIISPGRVDVRTGPRKKPRAMSGSGEFLELARTEKGWVVLRRGIWAG